MILDQTSGAIQQLATTAGLNVWTWTGISEAVVDRMFRTLAADSLVDGAITAQSLVCGGITADSLVDGMIAAQSEPN